MATGRKLFTGDTLAVLEELAVNNNSCWFKANKHRYDSHVLRPATQFSTIMLGKLEALTGLEHSYKIFRVYRDIRFSADKSPYNTDVRIHFRPAALGLAPGWFWGLSSSQVTIGSGIFQMDGLTLEAFRRAVLTERATPLKKIIKALEKQGAVFNEPELKRVPFGHAAGHPNATLLRRKRLCAWINVKDISLFTEHDATIECHVQFKVLKPIFDWLLELKVRENE